jgi:methyl-accepting chemotaxis protein
VSVSARVANLTIRTKILASFATVLTLLVGLGLSALSRSSTMNEAIQTITTNYGLSIIYLDEMRVDVATYRALIARELLQADDKAARQTATAALAAVVKTFDEAAGLYSPTVDPGAETGLWQEIKMSWRGYLQETGHVRELLDANKSAEAITYEFDKAAPAGSRAEAAVRAATEYNVAGMKQLTKEVDASYTTGRLVVIGFLIFAVAVAVVAGIFVTRTIATPVKLMTEAMRKLAAHDMNGETPGRGRTDEVGQMADAVQVFKDGMIAADRLAAEQETERAAKEQRSVRLERTVGAFEVTARDMVGLLSSGSTELEATARAMTGSADRTNQQASAVASAAEQAGAGAQTVAVATEELTASINEISRQVAQSARMAGVAVKDAQRTNTIVSALAEGADKIGNVVSLITDIAGQTNLLALNATIEAARAGDAGKGFAVVASEVKNLASQTGRATEEIGAQITQIQAATKEAVAAIRAIAASIEEVSAIATSIASAVEEQGAATADIARNVAQTATAAQDVTTNISGVGQSANDSSAAAGQVLTAAGELSKHAARLATEVNSFVAGVRAA